MEGGYSNPGNIVMGGPSGIEKSVFIYHFASAANLKENSYIICGNTSPIDIMKKAGSIGIDLKKENVRFIDCYSPTLGKSDIQNTDKVRMVSGPGALNDISLMLNEAIAESSGKRMRVVFDTLSTFVIYNPKDSIKKFLSVVQGRRKSAGATTMYLIDEGVHGKQLLSLLEQGMDEKYVIKRQRREDNAHATRSGHAAPFRVGPTGIVLI